MADYDAIHPNRDDAGNSNLTSTTSTTCSGYALPNQP